MYINTACKFTFFKGFYLDDGLVSKPLTLSCVTTKHIFVLGGKSVLHYDIDTVTQRDDKD
jgi:hypothetical protein